MSTANIDFIEECHMAIQAPRSTLMDGNSLNIDIFAASLALVMQCLFPTQSPKSRHCLIIYYHIA